MKGSVFTYANQEKENHLEVIDAINAAIENDKAQEVILCQGALSFYSIIEIVEKLPKNISKRFHAKSTESIIGSDFKETAGEVVFVEG